MAKFGWDDRRLFYVSEAAMENLSTTPSTDADSGQMLMYIKSDHLYIKKPSVAEILMVEDGVNLGTNPGDPDGAQIFKQKNSSAQLEFRTLKSSDGTVNFDTATDNNFIDITVDLSDINDELDHGLLLGLSDDDHAQYLLLAGRSGGQIANGGTAASDDLELRSTADSTKGSVKIVDGSDFEFGNSRYHEEDLSTSDGVDDKVQIQLSTDQVAKVDIMVVAINAAKDQRAVIEADCAAYEAAGSAVFLKNQKIDYQARSSGELSVGFGIDGTKVDIQVSQGNLGVAETVSWRVMYRVLTI